MPSMGGGAAEGLADVLRRKFLEAQLMQQAQIAQARLAEDARQADQGFSLGTDRLGIERSRVGLDRDEFGFKQSRAAEDDKRYAAEAPQREADVAYKGALTGEIIRKPQAEQAEREFASTRDKTLHGYRLGEIGASGAEDRRTKQTLSPGDRMKAEAPSAPSSPYTTERRARTRQSVGELITKVSPWTVGYGSLLSSVPQTDATNFQSELDTLKANIAFGELAEMREASKTGGALGQVSERELDLLSATLGGLNTKQSPANFKAQLEKVAASLDRWEAAKAQQGAAPAGSAPPLSGAKNDPLGIR